MTDYGSQFNNKTLAGYAALSGVKHHASIPYSKEKNGIVEEEVNRHIRNILLDKDCVTNWPQMLCMTEKLLNSSIKQPLRASPNSLLLGNATIQELGVMEEMDH